MGEARNAVIVWSADAVIVVGGSWGTLSEVALAMRRGGVPVVSVGGWRVVDADGLEVPGIAHVHQSEWATISKILFFGALIGPAYAAAPRTQAATNALRADSDHPLAAVHQHRSPGWAPYQCSACTCWPAR